MTYVLLVVGASTFSEIGSCTLYILYENDHRLVAVSYVYKSDHRLVAVGYV